MKNTLILTMMAAALLGGQVFAEPVVYKVSESSGALNITDTEAKIIVDAQKTIREIYAYEPKHLTLDYQGDFVLTSTMIGTPEEGVLNITTTVDSVAAKWEETFSVAEGGSITLCHAEGFIDDLYVPVQFFGKDKDSTVKLGGSEVKFMGVVEALTALDMNQVGVVWGEHDMLLVGKVQKSVPEPTTGSLSLLALAGLCARRRRK